MIRIHAYAGLYPQVPVSKSGLTRLFEKTVAALDLEEGDVVVHLISDAKSRQTNTTFLHLPGPTNVLAFEAAMDSENDAEAGARILAGEIFLNADALMRESLLYGQIPAEHLVRLLAHACLHLVGFEHGPLMDEHMESAVERVLVEYENGDSTGVFPF